MLQSMLRAVLHLGVAAVLLATPPALAQAGKKKATRTDPIVARVDGMPIRLSEILEAKALLPPEARKAPLARIYRPLLERVIHQKLIAAAGRKENLHKDARIRRQIALIEERLIQDAYMRKRIASKITPTAIKARYEKFVKSQKSGEEVKARHILVKTREQAMAIIAQLKKGADFVKLAKEKSIGPSKVQGGDLGWFSKGDMLPAFEKVVFTLKKGQFTSQPVRTEHGWHVIKVEGKRKKSPPKLAEIRNQLAQLIAQEAFRNEIKGLLKQAKIQRFNMDGSRPGARRGGGAIERGPALRGGATR